MILSIVVAPDRIVFVLQETTEQRGAKSIQLHVSVGCVFRYFCYAGSVFVVPRPLCRLPKKQNSLLKGVLRLIPDGPYMDMHTHILPGIDDGSQYMEQTVNMLRQEYDEGVRVVVATPHYGIRNPGMTLEMAKKALSETQKMADEITPGLKLILGSELFYSDGVIDALERGEAPTLGGTSHALIEFRTSDSRDRIYQCIREMTWKGFRPVIAHIERYKSLEGDSDSVRGLVEMGAAVQINCRSFLDGAPAADDAEGGHDQKKGLLGLFGKSEKKADRTGFFLERKGDWARTLLAEGLVHFIASDCHDDAFRSPVYRKALKAMEGCCSEQVLKDITKNNVVKLIRNERIV